jgi:hypothetical protein
MKLCRDCRWILPPEGDNARCGHPKARYREQSVVTGKAVERRHDCMTFRILAVPGMTCGPKGDLFEPKSVGLV